MSSFPAVRVDRVPASAFAWDSAEGVAAGLRSVVAAATAEDGRGPLNEAALLSLQHTGLSGAAMWGAFQDTRLAGFALVSGVPDNGSDGTSPLELNLVVAPEARGNGIGGQLAQAVLDAFGFTPSGSAPSDSGHLSAWSHGNHPAAAALASQLGFSRVRDLWVMRRSLAAELPDVAAPAHVAVRPFEPGRDEEAFLAVNAEAFVDHPEQGGLTRSDLELRMAEPWFDPAGFFLAEPDDGPVQEPALATVDSPSLLGFHWTKVHPTPAGADPAEQPAYGEVYVVGVSPAAQGMGLGKVLTLVGLHHLRSRGLGEVILYVESDNAPAVAMYEGLGFHHAEADTDVMYQR